MGNQNNNNGYENPYNPYNSDNSFNNEFSSEQNDKEKNKKETKKLLSFIKFFKSAGLKILVINGLLFTLLFKYQALAYIIDINNNYYSNGGYYEDVYRNIFMVLYVILTIFYYYFKYFKKKTIPILFIGMFLCIGLVASMPFTYVTKYDDNGIQINKIISYKRIPYSQVKSVDFTMLTLANEKQRGFEGNYDPYYGVTITDGTFKDASSVVNIHTNDRFKEMEKKFVNAQKNYLIEDVDSDTVGYKTVSRDEFFKEIDKYEPYSSNKSVYYDTDSTSISSLSGFDKWFVELFVKNK